MATTREFIEYIAEQANLGGALRTLPIATDAALPAPQAKVKKLKQR